MLSPATGEPAKLRGSQLTKCPLSYNGWSGTVEKHLEQHLRARLAAPLAFKTLQLCVDRPKMPRKDRRQEFVK